MKRIIVAALFVFAFCSCSNPELVWQEQEPIQIRIVRQFVAPQSAQLLNDPRLPKEAVRLFWGIDLTRIDWTQYQSVQLRVFLPEEQKHPVVIHLDKKSKEESMIAFFPHRYYNYQVVGKLINPKTIAYQAIQEGRVIPAQHL